MPSTKLTDAAAACYAALLRRRGAAFDSGRRPAARLAGAVVSIGNLSLGGTAKTPATILLGGELRRRGFRVDVLSRGYRRRTRGLAIAESGAAPTALVGDEPRLIARRLGAPVLVARRRAVAGREAERRYHTNLHLLDDGFQHRQLARDFDLVLLDPSDLDDRLLPAGRLREPPAALARASAVTLLCEPDARQAERNALIERVRRWTPAPVFFAHKRLLAPAPPDSPAVAFCALARPQSFFTGLQRAGWQLLEAVAFRDHHAYTRRDLRRLRQLMLRHCAVLATTEKDAMNLPADHCLSALQVIPMELEIEELEALVELIAAAARRRLALAEYEAEAGA